MNYIPNNYNNNRVEQLRYSDIPSMMETQQAVLDELIKEAKNFLKPREKKSLIRHLKTGMPILGIRDPDSGKVLATTLLCYPDLYKTSKEYRQNLRGYPLKDFDKSKIMVLQNVAVHPNHQGKGFIKDIFHSAAIMGVELGRSDMVAKVHRDNERSQQVFQSVGFTVYSKSVDRKNGDVHDYYRADAYDVWNIITDGNLALYDNRSRLIMK